MDQSNNLKKSDEETTRRRSYPPLRLCYGGCGLLGDPAIGYLCSKCHRDLSCKIKNILPPASDCFTLGLIPTTITVPATNPFPCFRALAAAATTVTAGEKKDSNIIADSTTTNEKKKKRCDCCNKKIGFLGFECRCRRSFCSIHRYPETHDCTFDYKAAGRLAIAKENPVCKADKMKNRL